MLYAYHTAMVHADNPLGSHFEKNEMKWNTLDANILMTNSITRHVIFAGNSV